MIYNAVIHVHSKVILIYRYTHIRISMYILLQIIFLCRSLEDTEAFPCAQWLMIWHCHCSGLGHCHGAGSVPGPGTFTYHGRGHKKEDIEYSSLCYTVCPCCLSLLNSAYMLNPTSFWSLLLAPSALLPPWRRWKKKKDHKKKKQKTKNKKHHCVIIGIFIPRAWQSIEEWKSENDMIRRSCFGSVVKNPA